MAKFPAEVFGQKDSGDESDVEMDQTIEAFDELAINAKQLKTKIHDLTVDLNKSISLYSATVNKAIKIGNHSLKRMTKRANDRAVAFDKNRNIMTEAVESITDQVKNRSSQIWKNEVAKKKARLNKVLDDWE